MGWCQDLCFSYHVFPMPFNQTKCYHELVCRQNEMCFIMTHVDTPRSERPPSSPKVYHSFKNPMGFFCLFVCLFVCFLPCLNTMLMEKEMEMVITKKPFSPCNGAKKCPLLSFLCNFILLSTNQLATAHWLAKNKTHRNPTQPNK